MGHSQGILGRIGISGTVLGVPCPLQLLSPLCPPYNIATKGGRGAFLGASHPQRGGAAAGAGRGSGRSAQSLGGRRRQRLSSAQRRLAEAGCSLPEYASLMPNGICERSEGGGLGLALLGLLSDRPPVSLPRTHCLETLGRQICGALSRLTRESGHHQKSAGGEPFAALGWRALIFHLPSR